MPEIISSGSGPLNKEDGSDGDDEGVSEGWTDYSYFWLAADAEIDKHDPGIIPPANNLEPVPDVVPDEPFNGIITSWRKGKQLGKGSTGAVYEAITDDGLCAVKEVSLSDPESFSQLEQEISVLSQLKHKNIVRYLGTQKDNEKLYLFLELMPGGSLFSLCSEQSLRESQVSAFTSQILEALEYLHSKMVIHRDIKCANILVDENGSVKLADFGLAKDTKRSAAKSSVGTPFYMAPEVFNNEDNSSYGLKADIWNLGCTVLAMLTGDPYLGSTDVLEWMVKIYQGETPEVPEYLSRDARDFILRCLKANPDDRPSAAQLLDDSFVREPPT